jgi:hypothetical protein
MALLNFIDKGIEQLTLDRIMKAEMIIMQVIKGGGQKGTGKTQNKMVGQYSGMSG